MSNATPAPDSTAPTSVAPYPWSPLPDEGDFVTSTQILGMGTGLEQNNEIAKLVGDGFNVYRVKVLTLEADCGFSLVSLWRETGLNDAFAYLINISLMDARLLGHGIAVRDAADVHKALNFVPEEIKGH